MLVYRFLSEQWALEALRDRRLKLALIEELNDPFELLGANLKDKNLRRAFNRVKEEMSTRVGMLCFSKQWHNPVLWSHYADKHRGICLGFNVPTKLLQSVSYDLERVAPEDDWLKAPEELKIERMNRFLSTKFRHWEYEAEVRQFFRLKDQDPQNGHYFVEFSRDLTLTQVVIGARSPLAPRDIFAVVSAPENIKVIPSRLAFQSFRVVRDKSKFGASSANATPSIRQLRS
jgi:hypothetical protein